MTSPALTPGVPRKRVVVLGCGFAGLNAVDRLSKMPVDVTVIDKQNHHVFQPMLYQVALAVLSPDEIAQPIRSMVRDKRNVQVMMDEATNIDAIKK